MLGLTHTEKKGVMVPRTCARIVIAPVMVAMMGMIPDRCAVASYSTGAILTGLILE